MERYKNQVSLSAIGETGQAKLKQSAVLVIGAGGLGCPALTSLVGAGVGKLGIVDGDSISIENLHRQLLYTEKDIGQLKSNVAKKHLVEKNSEVTIISYPIFLNENNAEAIISEYDFVLDCTDRMSARYLINDVCVMLNKTWIFGALHQFEGQLSVFNHNGSGTYRCLFPESIANTNVSNCQEIGVFPTLPNIIGTMQANEAFKIILNLADIASDTLLIIDVRNWQIRRINYQKIVVSEKINNRSSQKNCSIFSKNLSQDHALIDIRLFSEIEKIPAPQLIRVDVDVVSDYIKKNEERKTFVLVCNKGNKSHVLARKLQSEGIKNVLSLNGGIHSILPVIRSKEILENEFNISEDIFYKGAIPASYSSDIISKLSSKSEAGAHAIFLGQIRKDIVKNNTVQSINYTAQETLTQAEFRIILDEIYEDYDIIYAHVRHSLGSVKAGEICLIAIVSSAHRSECQLALDRLVENVKQRLPIFGKEEFTDGNYQWKRNTEKTSKN